MKIARARNVLLTVALAVVVWPNGTHPRAVREAAAAPAYVLHEPIPEGAELPSDLAPRRGAATGANSGANSAASARPRAGADSASSSTFQPDRDTRRPDVLPYQEVFQPSIAPFKRLSAFDAVSADYTLSVRDAALVPLSAQGLPVDAAREDRFVGHIPLVVLAGAPQRIASVGAGARVVSAILRAGAAGGRAVPFTLAHDGADNWFLSAREAGTLVLTLELAIAREAYGGDFGHPDYATLPAATSLPESVIPVAAEIQRHIGVSRALTPRENLDKLVTYFRSFTETEDVSRTTGGDIYRDLALAQKGVCRHRAFAFLVTALSLGMPTRMLANEAHAWVEVHNGLLWKRIDLGGAGGGLSSSVGELYEPPPDPFAWPPNATRGDDLARGTGAPNNGATGDRAKSAATTEANATRYANGNANAAAPDPASVGTADAKDVARPPRGASTLFSPGSAPSASSGFPKAWDPAAGNAPEEGDPRGVATIVLGEVGPLVRGMPLNLRGDVTQSGSPCPRLSVSVVLREIPNPRNRGASSGAAAGAGKAYVLGTMATNEKGHFEASVTVPTYLPSAEYDLVAHTLGDARCGRGLSP